MDQIYHFIISAEHIIDEIYDSLFRSKGIEKTIKFSFRLDYSIYDENGSDIGRQFYWNVILHGRGGRYIKVLWQQYSYHPFKKEEDWKEIADHDSCWCGCWGDILKKAREIFPINYCQDGSWFFNLEQVHVLTKKEIENVITKNFD